jgi:hypothetical protein
MYLIGYSKHMKNDPDKFSFTVEELIEVLKKIPGDMPVLVSGYENGYENFYQHSICKLKHEPDNPYYDGEFQPVRNVDTASFDAVILERVTRD